jgi:RNA polymerase sigma factor (TIGR02999 family)
MSAGPVTLLLRARAEGDASAEGELIALIYAELRRIAERQMRGERPGHTLTPTALVHEAWLRLGEDAGDARDRIQFLALAGHRMRQVLVDHARRRNAGKRGGGNDAVTLSGIDAAAPEPEVDVLALDQALQQLEAYDPRKASVVELRYFAGMEMGEIAALLGVSRATAQRDWEVARAFLHAQLS